MRGALCEAKAIINLNHYINDSQICELQCCWSVEVSCPDRPTLLEHETTPHHPSIFKQISQQNNKP